MDDLAEKINSLLSDPESLKQLGELAQSLGLPPPPSDEPPPSVGSVPDIAALTGLAEAVRTAGEGDDNINFLNALRPLLSDEKKPRVDRAIKILKLLNILPALRDSGLLGGDFLNIL